MPPARRRQSSGPAAKSAQKTLSFHNSSKISKPSSITPTSPLIKEEKISSLTTDDVKPILDPIPAPAEEPATVEKEKSTEEIEADAITDKRIKAYWREREAERITKRVHQKGLSVEEKILRLWDMSSHFGPAIGISRGKRWERANRLGLNPPIEVLAVLRREEAKGAGKDRAYVDELMSSWGVAEEV